MAKNKMASWREGDFVLVPLGDSRNAFGRILPDPLMAFYDLNDVRVPGLPIIAACQILFRVWIRKFAITDGLWPVIGNQPLELGPMAFT